MKTCVVYFSRTGNTKRLAQAIAETVKAPIFSMAETQPSAIQDCDLLIIGSPVEGASPAKEASAFIESMPKVEHKKAIVFCTHRIFGSSRAMGKMEKMLNGKGYETVLKVAKKGMKPDQEADFSEVLSEVKKAVEKQ
ncbi:MAG: flavodoxin family protein [Candidatus Bathyarchaeia archaeon]|jgi:flavodoxin